MAESRTYRPAWFLRLYVRLEDFGADTTSQADIQSTETPFDTKSKAIDANIAKNEALIAQEEVAYVTGSTRSRKVADNLRATNAKLVKQKANLTKNAAVDNPDSGDDFSISFVTVPLEMEIEDRGFREADQLTAAFPYIDMPLDPRLLRECRVEGYLGTVNSSDFGTPGNWHLKPAPSRRCVRRFNGYVDMPEMEHSDATATIHIKARSYEAVLIDGKINPHAPAYRPQGDHEFLTVYINRILSLYPPTSGSAGGDPFQSVWFAADPTLEPTLGRRDLMRSLQTAASRNRANGAQPGQDAPIQSEDTGAQDDPNGTGDSAPGGEAAIPPGHVTPDGMSIWDLITQACELCGCMPLYQPALASSGFNADGTQTPLTGGQNGGAKSVTFGPANDIGNYLLLTPPQCFLDDISDAKIRVKGGSIDRFSRSIDLGDGTGRWTSDVRFMVWGHNIGSLKLSRKMGRTRPTAVEVRAYNPDAHATLRMLSARFPSTNKEIHEAGQGAIKSGKKARKQTAKGHGKIDVVRTFVVQGVRNVQQLEDIAVSMYHQLTRGELSIELETDDLSSYMDPDASMQSQSLVKCENDDPDLLRLCAGTPVRVTVASQKDDNLIISSLSDFYGGGGQNVGVLMAQQQDRWGNWLGPNGQQSAAELDKVVTKIQRAYTAAKLPDIFYVRSIKLHCSSDEGGGGFKATMELINYMNDSDPASMDADTRAMNDRLKLKVAQGGKKNIKAAAEAAKTKQVIEDMQLMQMMDNNGPRVARNLL